MVATVYKQLDLFIFVKATDLAMKNRIATQRFYRKMLHVFVNQFGAE